MLHLKTRFGDPLRNRRFDTQTTHARRRHAYQDAARYARYRRGLLNPNPSGQTSSLIRFMQQSRATLRFCLTYDYWSVPF